MAEGFMVTLGILFALLLVFLLCWGFTISVGYKLIGKVLDTIKECIKAKKGGK